MNLCSPLNFILSSSEQSFMNIAAGVLLLISLSGSFIMLFTCNKVRTEFAFAKLTFFIAIWDIIFNISVYIALFLQKGALCDAIQTIENTSVSMSLSCLLVVSISCLCGTRKQQNYFMMNYNKGLIVLYLISFAHGGVSLYFNINGNVFSDAYFYSQIWLPSLLILIILFCNLRLIYVIKKNDMELKDQTPAFLSAVLFVIFLLALTCTFYNFYKEPSPYLWILDVLLEEISGFANYAISFSRIKRAVDTIEDAKRLQSETGIPIESEVNLTDGFIG